jgi:beta-glucosidase
MQKRTSQLPLLTFTAVIIGVGIASAQDTNRPWMDSQLSPEQRSELVLKQLALDEKLALVHGNGMAGEPQWQMPLTHLTNGGAGYFGTGNSKCTKYICSISPCNAAPRMRGV